MNIALPPELEQFILDQVNSGRYLSTSEVVHAALRLLMERDRLQEMKLQTLREEVAIGIDQSDRGECFDGEEVIQKLLEEISHDYQSSTHPYDRRGIPGLGNTPTHSP